MKELQQQHWAFQAIHLKGDSVQYHRHIPASDFRKEAEQITIVFKRTGRIAS